MSTFLKATGRTIQDAFDEFHQNNPHVYSHFKRLVFKALKLKKKKCSSKMIINVIRWEIYLETKENTLFADKEGVLHKFRINDAYHSRYARKFAKDYPELSTIFNYKDLRS